MKKEILRILKDIVKDYTDMAMVVTVIGILCAMLLPLPPVILDLLLALNITIAIIVLITTMYTVSPLDFSIFPSVLLILTLFRLSLNVASTRLILLHGSEGSLAAGAIIKSFGSFVVGGNYVIGMIIFVILVLINFIVITKGSGRIAEVAARFTLDGMPGKQMAIDADLNAGIIDENEARERRKVIAKESEFHGAMDGASKFVRGDAIAGIIITAINIIGGFIIGVFQQGMSMIDAAENYTLLTVGDGLITQIPALIISTSAGLLVSRAASEDRMGREFLNLIFANPNPIYIGAAVVFMIGMVPGLPAFPFMTLSLILIGAVYYYQSVIRKKVKEPLPAAADKKATEHAGPEEVEHLLTLDAMELEVGYGLIPLVDSEQAGDLLGRIRSIRRQFATEMGIIIPPVHIRDNLKLKPSEYRLMIKGVQMAGSELMVNHLLAMDPGNVTRKIEGVPTMEPAFNLPALWIPPEKEEDAKFNGYTVVDNATVIATHLTEVIRNNASDLLGRQEVQHLLDNLAKTHPKAVEELIPNQLPLGILQKVLQNLLRERVSVRDLLTIVEVLADYAPMSKDPDLLTEYVRQKLARSMLSPYVQDEGVLPVITVDQEVENVLTKSIQHTDHGSYLAAEPKIVDSIVGSIKEEIEKIMAVSIQPIILCSPLLRRHLRKLVEQFAPSVFVFSHAEILQNIQIKSTGRVMLRHGR
ncbi:MAG: flagellar biosynthesis protein FlhA [Desulfobacteraceae bacterium]|nr:MAG: flagellar biosynthesis protein FlhA [Desulfobacteraceae bacterium]